jgi:ATP-dependent helicase HrpB
VLRDLVGRRRVHELDRLVPTSVVVASGRSVPVDYTGDLPAISVRAQELFGTTVHPTVAEGRVPIAVHLLSPAGRPIQITADLPGFWAGSWKEVRKEMAGRYPKHDWPLDASTAAPRRPRPRRSSG